MPTWRIQSSRPGISEYFEFPSHHSKKISIRLLQTTSTRRGVLLGGVAIAERKQVRTWIHHVVSDSIICYDERLKDHNHFYPIKRRPIS